MSDEFLAKLFQSIQTDPDTEVEVNLEKQEIKILSSGEKEKFDINPYKKKCLVNGYDDIDYLLSIKDKIEFFENSRTISYS